MTKETTDEQWMSMLEAGAKVILRERRCNGPGLSDLCLAEAVYRSMERARQEYENVGCTAEQTPAGERFLLAILEDGAAWGSCNQGIYDNLKKGYMDCDAAGRQLWLTETGKRYVEGMPYVGQA